MAKSSTKISDEVDRRLADHAIQDSQDLAAEARPLLVKTKTGSSRVKRAFKATPLPLVQLFILAFVRLAEPISFTQVSGGWNDAASV